MKMWQDTVLSPKLEEIANGLDDKLSKLVYGGMPVPLTSTRIDKE